MKYNYPVMKEETSERTPVQKFFDGFLEGVLFIASILLCIVLYIIIMMLVPFFLYPFVMFFGNFDVVCYFYNLCWDQKVMMTVWVIAFIISPPTILGFLSYFNITHPKPVTTLPV